MLGPSAVPLGGFESTVLLRTYTEPLKDALLYAAQAAGRKATQLLLRQPNQAMPNEREFDRLIVSSALTRVGRASDKSLQISGPA